MFKSCPRSSRNAEALPGPPLAGLDPVLRGLLNAATPPEPVEVAALIDEG
jgi:hypothetical protein